MEGHPVKLYRPVLIESVEQAEALPLSTRAIRPDGHAAARLDGVNEDGQWTSKLRLYAHDEVIGWTALVPIEAEEEWTAMGSDNGEPWISHVGHDGIDGSREEAQQYVDRFGGFIAHRTRTPWEEA